VHFRARALAGEARERSFDRRLISQGYSRPRFRAETRSRLGSRAPSKRAFLFPSLSEEPERLLQYYSGDYIGILARARTVRSIKQSFIDFATRAVQARSVPSAVTLSLSFPICVGLSPPPASPRRHRRRRRRRSPPLPAAARPAPR